MILPSFVCENQDYGDFVDLHGCGLFLNQDYGGFWGLGDLHGCLWIGMDCVPRPVDTALKPV